MTNFMGNSIEKLDLFPNKVNFTYKGQDSFPTIFGGITSLFIFMILTAYGINLFLIMIYRKDSNKSKNTEFRNLNEYDQNLYLHEKGFRFAVAFTDALSNPIPLHPQYFTLEIQQQTIINTGSGYTFQSTDLGYDLCVNLADYNDLNNYFERSSSSNAYCPVKNDYKVAGNYLAKNYQLIGINLKKCTSG
jgi:hypothetical protein